MQTNGFKGLKARQMTAQGKALGCATKNNFSLSPGERCSLSWKVFFHGSYSRGGRGGLERGVEASLDPRAVRFEASFMLRRVIGTAVLPQSPEHFEPTLAQTAQRAGVVVAFLALALVIRLRPRAFFAAAVGPQMHRVPQHHVARPADAGFVQLPTLEAHRTDASLAAERVGIGID